MLNLYINYKDMSKKFNVIKTTKIGTDDIQIGYKGKYLCVVENGITVHTAIDINNIEQQPMYKPIQAFINILNEQDFIENVLVLGAGGCCFPRYLINKFVNIQSIDAIEYSKDMLNICQQYFLDNLDTDKLSLINTDGFDYIKQNDINSYDLIFVDMFASNTIAKIEDIEFITNLYNILNYDGFVCFNTYTYDLKNCLRFCKEYLQIFDDILIVQQGNESVYYVIANKNMLNFVSAAKTFKDLYEFKYFKLFTTKKL